MFSKYFEGKICPKLTFYEVEKVTISILHCADFLHFVCDFHSSYAISNHAKHLKLVIISATLIS